MTLITARHQDDALKVAEFLRQRPEHHNQHTFASMLAGRTVAWVRALDSWPEYVTVCIAGMTAIRCAPGETVLGYSYLRFPDGEHELVSLWAREYYGMTEEEARSIFFCMDSSGALNRLEAWALATLDCSGTPLEI